MSVKGIGESLVASQISETNSLPNKFVGNSAFPNNTDTDAVSFMTAQFVGNQTQQDNIEQKAKELIDKYTPKNVILVGKFDSKGLGAELAGLVSRQPKLGAAVFSQLSAGDKADAARAMIDNLNDETLKGMTKTPVGKTLLEQTGGLLDGKTTNMWDFRSFASGDNQRVARIQNAFGKPQIEQKPQAQKIEGDGNNVEFKPINEDQLAKAAPALSKNPAKLKEYTQLLNETMKETGINTPAQQAAFIGTCSAETIGFTAMTEGDSNFASSKSNYKGRGIIQLTDKAGSKPTNYLSASQFLKLGSPDTNPPYRLLVDKPELAAKSEYSFKIAGWFWAQRKHEFGIPNEKVGEQPRADLRDFREASSLVNSGRPDGPVNHWGDRLTHYKRALAALNIEVGKELSDNINKGIKNYTGKPLPPEPSYIQWKREQRAKRGR